LRYEGAALIKIDEQAEARKDEHHDKQRYHRQENLSSRGAADWAIVSWPGNKYGDCPKPQAKTREPTTTTLSTRYQW
jgi:hypothetical protein